MIKYKVNLLVLVFLVFAFLAVGSIAASLKLHPNRLPHIGKVADSVHRYFGDKDKESHRLWVFFNSKNYNGAGHRSEELDISDENLETASKQLDITKRAIERRNRRSQRSGLDEDDLPVQQSLIDSVAGCGRVDSDYNYLRVFQRSKWLNAISILIDVDLHDSAARKEQLLNQIMHCITALPFVDRVDLVRKFTGKSHPKEGEELKVQDAGVLIDAPDTAWRQRKTLSSSSEDNNKLFYGNTYDGVNQVNAIAAHDIGLNGDGLVILILDSGFLTSHEVFQNLSIIATFDFINNVTNVTSPFGNEQNRHGTATLSTIAGYNPGTMVGPAYKAHFLLAMTENTSTEIQQEEDYWMSGLEWGEANGAELATSSLGYTSWYHYYNMNGTFAAITLAADKAVAKGMVVVSSAGNDGPNGIGAPADGLNVITVGAIDDSGSVTSFSSRGPSADGRVKPDIAALGLRNYVASAACDTCYTHMSGTSFSCPLAAGSIALIMQKNPTWTPQQIYQAIIATSSQSNTPDINKGYGILNTFNALNFAPNATTVDCTTRGCSGHGGCCNKQCYCAPDRYGPFCEYSRVQCGSLCINRNGTCAIDQYDYSFLCTQSTKSIVDTTGQCKVCDGKFDACGVCGGNNKCAGCDGVPYSNVTYDSCGVCGGNGDCKAIITDTPTKGNDSKITKIVVGSVVGLFVTAAIIGVIIKLRAKKLTPSFIPMKPANFNNGDGILFVEESTSLQPKTNSNNNDHNI